MVLLIICLRSFLVFPSTPNKPSDYFFFANGMHFQSQLDSGMIIDKAEFWLEILDSNNINGFVVVNPFAVRPRETYSRPLIVLEKLAVLNLLQSFFFRKRKWFIDKCDPKLYIERTRMNRIIVETYHQFLDRNPVKLILGIGLNSTLVLVAREHGIKTIEFQHGVGFQDEYIDFGKSPSLPDGIFVWDKHFCESSGNGSVTKAIGYPKDFSSLSDRMAAKELLPKKRFLVSLSYGDVESVDPGGVMNRQVYECISRLVANNYQVTLRPHPASLTGIEVSLQDRIYYRKFLPWFKDDELLSKTSLDMSNSLFDALLNNDFHLTFASSVVLEAAYLGVPSFLVCKPEQIPFFPKEIFKLGMTIFTTPGTILSDLELNAKSLNIFRNDLDKNLFIETISKIVNPNKF